MSGYHELTKVEIKQLQKKLILPNINYPHYLPITSHPNDNSYKKIKLTDNIIIEVNKYGDVKYNGEILKQYAIGSFLHCAVVKIDDFGNVPVYELVKLAFDPIKDRALYEIHHINNNALDNRPENLIYVTKDEHRLIDETFNKELIRISRIITKNNRIEIKDFFNKNPERSFNGSEILKYFNHTSFDRIKYNMNKLCRDKIINRIENHDLFIFQKFILNENR